VLYYLGTYLYKQFKPPGFGLFHAISFRMAAAAVTALFLSFVVGPIIIRLLKKRQVDNQAKVEAPKNHLAKAGIPTMGGLIVLMNVLVPTLLWGDIGNAYVIMIMLTTVWMGLVGFSDDYFKVVKKYKKGLIARYKLIGQIGIGLIIGGTIYFFPEWFGSGMEHFRTLSTVPFLKSVNFDFSWLYIPIVIFIITATSNAVNLTDGLDGLAIGTVGVVALTLALVSYVSGNAIFAHYLNIMHLPGADELAVYCAALVGGSLGFLWFNAYPAQVFMGDTGSLALGGAIGALCVLIKKEFLLPIVGGIFFAETISVIIQVAYFKYTRKKYGEGKRVFKMAPIHHHFELKGWAEPKIVTRFYIVAVILAIISLTTFKVR